MREQPYPIKVNGERFLVFGYNEHREEYLAEHPRVNPKDIGIIAVAKFHPPYDFVDYMSVAHNIDDVTGECDFINSYNNLGWIDYVSGFALTPERIEALGDAIVKLGVFTVKYGWGPTVIVENQPDEEVIDNFIKADTKDLNDNDYMPEEE